MGGVPSSTDAHGTAEEELRNTTLEIPYHQSVRREETNDDTLPRDVQESSPSHESDSVKVDTSTIDLAPEEHQPESSGGGTETNNDDHRRRPGLFFLAIAAVSVGGMGMASFGALAGGKWGMALPKGIFDAGVYAAVDVAVNINDAPALRADPAEISKLLTRSACWLSIGVVSGSASALRLVSVDTQHEGAVWQLEPILYELAFDIFRIGLNAGIMLRAHRDHRPNVMKWFVLVISSHFLWNIGNCTPYPLVSGLASLVCMSTGSVGLYFLVNQLDKHAEQKHVRNGYNLLVGFGLGGYGIPYTVLYMTSRSFSDYGIGQYGHYESFAISGLNMVFQKMVLIVLMPVLERCFGDGHDKLWTYVVPAALLALELGPCLLLLGTNMSTLEFWLLIAMQELNSVAKNTGIYAELYLAVRSRLGRPVGEKECKRMAEKRSTIAPCDNIAEIVSPVVIITAIGLESFFDALPIERAPYFAGSGLLGGWRNQRFYGEAPIMLTIVFVVRIAFCWIEIKVRAHRRNDTTGNGNSAIAEAGRRTFRNHHDEASRSSEPDAAPAAKRRASMAVLYHRIVRSDDSPVHMQYLAAALFASQPIIFVSLAAQFGKETWASSS